VPIPPNRRIRNTLTVVGALGLIAAGSASIVAGTASGDGEVRLTAAAPGAERTTATGAPAETVEALPDTSPTATPSVSKSAGPSVSASVVPPRSTLTTVRPSTQPTSSIKRRPRVSTPATSTPASDGTASSSVTAEVIRLVNIERQKAGCSGLSGESRLEAAAQKHSELQAAQNSMSHQLPGEASMGDRVTAEGYRWRGVAENVAAGYTSPASVMNGWMNSPGHKANILNCAYTEIGVGLAKSSSGTQYWTQNFATPA
jgi:uncharacterized protein YkwD